MSSGAVRLLVPESVQRLPADLVLLLGFIFLTGVAVFVPGVRTVTPLRIAVGILFVLFAPGYALLAATFPRGPLQSSNDESDTISQSSRLASPYLGLVERFVLSVATSVATVILLGLVLDFSPWSIGIGTVYVVLALFSVLAVVAAAWRYQNLPTDQQTRPTLSAVYRAGRRRLLTPQTRPDRVLNVVLALSVLFAIWGVGFAATGQQSDSLTEVGLLATQSDGELTATDYPTNVTTGDSNELVLTLRNLERERLDYSVVTQLQRVRETGNETIVVEEQELRRTSTTLSHNETQRFTHNLTVSQSGSYRLNYLVYRGVPPENPGPDNAYREVHLWINVTAADG